MGVVLVFFTGSPRLFRTGVLRRVSMFGDKPANEAEPFPESSSPAWRPLLSSLKAPVQGRGRENQTYAAFFGNMTVKSSNKHHGATLMGSRPEGRPQSPPMGARGRETIPGIGSERGEPSLVEGILRRLLASDVRAQLVSRTREGHTPSYT